MKIKSKLLNIIMLISLSAALLLAFFYSISSNNREDKVLVISEDFNSMISYNIYSPNSSTDSTQKLSGSLYTLEDHSPGVYVSKTNTLYFTKPIGNSGFQLFKKILSSSVETQICTNITDRFVFADFIDVNSKNSILYLRVIQKGHRNLQLAVYDIAKDEISIWDENEQDITYSSINYLNSKNILLAAKYSLANTSSYEICSLTTEGKNIKTLEKCSNLISDVDMSSNGRYLLTIETDISKPEMGGRTFLRLKDTLKNKTEVIASDKTGYYELSHARFSSNNSRIYFTAVKGNAQYMTGFNNPNFGVQALYCFDMKTKRISEAVKMDSKYIMNFDLLN